MKIKVHKKKVHPPLPSRDLLTRKNYISYLFSAPKVKTLRSLILGVIRYVRRFTLVSALFKATLFIIGALETGALVIAVSATFLVAAPVVLIFGAICYISSLFESRRCNQRLGRLFSHAESKKIYVFFLAREQTSSAFCGKNISDICEKQDAIGIVVSPCFFSARSPLSQRREFYFTARAEGSSLLIIRKYYFFSLKRALLSRCPERVAYVF